MHRAEEPHLNLAVSGSISSSSRTGERGTLAENFSAKQTQRKAQHFNIASHHTYKSVHLENNYV